jgi:hypothetical protein
MLYKTTKRLFKGLYQYKLVITCAGASWFRGGDMDSVLNELKKVVISDGTQKSTNPPFYSTWKSSIKTQDDLDYAFKLQTQLKKLKDLDVRVETPWITIYTNNKSHIDTLIKIDQSKIKYVSIPPSNIVLDENTVILPKVDYDYKITMGKTTTENSAFVQWAEGNAKLKLTKSCKKELIKDRSWGGSYFYVTGENNLLMAKMHLGGSINKIERIIKA